MKSHLNEGKSTKDLLNRIKEAVRKWYGTLSVKELVVNKALVAEIEAFERLLSKQEVLS
ncbi:MAG: hypothetical protein AB7G93_01125 [Bdellovibrionales bacterium]